MARAPGWERRFERLLVESGRRRFEWGTFDCCMFAADAVLALTGVDRASDLRGSYASVRQATRLVARLGGMRAIGARAGEPIAPLHALAGDVGLVDDGLALAVCRGPDWAQPGRAGGLESLPLRAAALAWRV